MTRNGIAAKNSAFGYGLVELMLALSCAVILITVAAVNITKLQQEWSLWGAARVLEASLQWGRMHAIASNAPVIFEVNDIEKKFYWVDASSGDLYANSVRYLPAGIRIEAAPRRPVRFYQHGNAAPAGTYTLAGDAGSYSIVVSPGGRIRIQRN